MTVKMGQFQRYTGNLNIETLLSIVEVIVYIDGNCDNRIVHTKLYKHSDLPCVSSSEHLPCPHRH